MLIDTESRGGFENFTESQTKRAAGIETCEQKIKLTEKCHKHAMCPSWMKDERDKWMSMHGIRIVKEMTKDIVKSSTKTFGKINK